MNYSYFPAIPKFIIAAINGPAAGLGFVIPLYADLRFAAESAVFTTAFAQRGLIAEHGVSWLLPRLVGLPAAMDLLCSARKFRAPEALAHGAGEPRHRRRQADGRDPRLCHAAGQHRLAALGRGDEAADLGGRVPDPGRGHDPGQLRDGTLLPDRRFQGRRRPLPREAAARFTGN